MISYLETHSSAEPAELAALYRDTYVHRLYPRMCTDHLQGRLLAMLTAMVAPKRVLELGTFTGYSTLCLAEGMPAGSTIDTIEIDDEHAEALGETFRRHARSGVAIHLHIGDALEIIPTLEPGWDLVFIDANKRHYADYLAMVRDLIPDGAFIIADNTLWDQHLAEPKDPQSCGIARFNDIVAADPTLFKVILPIHDGMTLIQKRNNKR